MSAQPNDLKRCLQAYNNLVKAISFIRAFELNGADFRNEESELGIKKLPGVCSVYLYVSRMVEELSNISFATAKDYPDMHWDQIRGMRNRMFHAYFSFDNAFIWEALMTADCDQVVSFCREYAMTQGFNLPDIESAIRIESDRLCGIEEPADFDERCADAHCCQREQPGSSISDRADIRAVDAAEH